MKDLKLIVIDNYDSFVYNICDYLGRLGVNNISVYRNDEILTETVIKNGPDAIIVSPGPGHPGEAGISIELILKANMSNIPIFGVCLGHQAIGQAYGANIIRANRILHGKTSQIHHNGKDLFKGLKNPFEATRYHSLIIEEKTIPDVLEITARSEEGEIMAVKHKQYPCYGVQFHPESILTEEGLGLIDNFLAEAESFHVS